MEPKEKAREASTGNQEAEHTDLSEKAARGKEFPEMKCLQKTHKIAPGQNETTVSHSAHPVVTNVIFQPDHQGRLSSTLTLEGSKYN